MKILFSLFCSLLPCHSLFPQNEIVIGYGRGTAPQLIDAYTADPAGALAGRNFTLETMVVSGAFQLAYRRHLSPRFFIGLAAGAEIISQEVIDYSGGTRGYRGVIRHGFRHVLPGAGFRYVDRRRFKLQSTVWLGAAFVRSRYLNDDNVITRRKSSELAYQVDVLGVRVGRSDFFGLFLNLGFGFQGVVNAGFSAQF